MVQAQLRALAWWLARTLPEPVDGEDYGVSTGSARGTTSSV